MEIGYLLPPIGTSDPEPLRRKRSEPHRVMDRTLKLVCSSCDWVGVQTDCVHGYESTPGQGVEPVDYCPKCGGIAGLKEKE